MSQRRTISKAGWGVIAIAVVVIIGLLVAGIMALTSDKPGHGSDAGVLHAEHDPVADDPYLTAAQAATTMFSFTPAEQDYPEQGLRKIQDSLTGQLEDLAVNPPPQNPKQLPESWQAWKKSGEHIYANVDRAGDTRFDGDEVATVPLEISQVIVHPSDETTPYKRFEAEFRVEKSEGRWKAASWEFIAPITD